MSDPSRYTVGWICAIATEFVVAKVMLDEAHDGPEHVATNDNNSYALGRVGKHNVTIAVLPDGEYGTSSAAAVARDMLHSFPNIRIGLMVGIGGGAPNKKNDIRLGDVVVSSPQGGKGGVFQYDFGGTIQEQRFQTTGFLDQPPIVLRTAVNNVKTAHEIDGAQLENIIDHALAKNPRLRKKYQRQDADSDRLYYPDIVHPVGVVDCTGHCDYEQSNWVPRPARGECDDNPAVHYGLIASANQLMGDAKVRDRLAEDKGILCFEMEAAGLMNHFPCLVIRGICDYADSHTNKAWQGYAAMTAAAYAKQLLAKIAPNRLEAEKKISDAVASVDAKVEAVNTLITDVNTSVQKSNLRQQNKEIQYWLRPPDPWTNYHKALGQRHPSSGSWLLQHKCFLSWKAGESSCLWLHGVSGCGKTVLSSTVIEALSISGNDQAVLRFYFDFSDETKQKLEDMIRSLISQLGLLRDDCQKLLDALFFSCGHGYRQPSYGELRNLLLTMLENAGEVWIVIDALDESTSRRGESSESVLAWLQELLGTKEMVIHIVATSRPERDIQNAMERMGGSVRGLCIQAENIQQDIRSYIRSRLETDLELKRWQAQKKVQDEIETSVLREVDGMFRLVACRLDMLRDCRSEYELRHEISRLPETLNNVYQRMLHNIPKHRLPAAIRILQLLLFSPNPLEVKELSHAIAVETDAEPYLNTTKCLVDANDIALYCSGLTVLVRPNEESDLGLASLIEPRHRPGPVLQLSHLSVKEYLCSDKISPDIKGCFQERAAKSTLADVCISYLLHIQEDISADAIRQRFPFAQHCAEQWYHYGEPSRTQPAQLRVKMIELLKQDTTHCANWIRLTHSHGAIMSQFRRHTEPGLCDTLFCAKAEAASIRAAEKKAILFRLFINRPI